MESNGSKKIGLWMDQSHAIFIGCQNNQAYVIEELKSPLESHIRIPGEGSDMTRVGTALGGISNNEIKKNNIFNNLLKKYFNELKEKISDSEEVLLMGTGVTKNQFLKHIKGKKNLAHVKVHLRDANKMTINQLLATVKAHYSSSD
jgi:hypothetical protein